MSPYSLARTARVFASMLGSAVVAALLAGCSATTAEDRMRADLATYNVAWTTPGPDSSASMPIGNGTVGANVWTEPSGDLVFYVSRTDAWSENERLLKLGEVRVSIDPNPLARGGTVRQELVLGDGRIDTTLTPSAGDDSCSVVRMSLWVDADDPVIRVSVRSDRDVRLSVTGRTWRTEPRRITDADELRSVWSMRDAPADVAVIEGADVVVGADRAPSALAWYHRNEHSIVPFTVERQGLSSIRDKFPDPLLHRTLGCWIEGGGLGRVGPMTLAGSGRSFDVAIVTDSRQTQTAGEWIAGVESMARELDAASRSRSRTAAWWKEFWERSWIFIEGDPPLDGVPSNAHPLRVGVDSNGQNGFQGLVAQPWVFAGALGDDEVSRLARLDRSSDTPDSLRERLAFAAARVASGVDPPPASPTEFRLPPADLTGPASLSESLARGFTVSVWIKPEPGADGRLGPARIFDKMTAGGSDGFIFDTHPGTSLRLICGQHTLSVDNIIVADQWQHVAASYDALNGSMQIYRNGEIVADSPASIGADPPPPSQITRSYILQRWILGCSSRGSMYPPKFNGSIFTVEPRHVNNRQWNPDWRAWGGSYWWQNTRLPYYPMLAAGDYDLMHPLFDFYGAALDPSRARAKEYYGADGVYFPETMTMFFTYANGDYGWNREGLAAGDISPCPWWKWAWNQSLELSQLMLDYYEYTGDEAFLRDRTLPMVDATLDYFQSRFVTNQSPGGAGDHRRPVMTIRPTQAVETYWHEVENDAPSVAGVRCVAEKVLALPEHLVPPQERDRCQLMLEACPPLPMKTVDGVVVAAPAGKYRDERSNCETPELYPVFPFGLAGIARPGLEASIEAYKRRHDKATVGWTQDGAFAAMLGLRDEARAQLVARARNSHRNFRFPAMWGPNFDWLPDQCHGGNLMVLTQLMLMQPVGDKVYLLPAWPPEWNARFKLHAPGNTVVEATVEHGRIVKLDVDPPSRAKDLVVWGEGVHPRAENDARSDADLAAAR
ncbi:MAG: hypothetical protein GIKADHBN_00811 [Phycisphaerales bacterium]|nr:hypothetical protein [Phycisphaerales bacterium]